MNKRNFWIFTVALILGMIVLGGAIEVLTGAVTIPGLHMQAATHEGGGKAPVGWQGAVAAHTSEHHIGGVTILAFFLLAAAILWALSFRATRKMSLRPHPWQNLAEQVVESFDYMATNIIGPHGKQYAPLLGTCFMFILFMNLMGLIPWAKAPTANLNVTISLAIGAVVLVHFYSIRKVGIKKYIVHYLGEPIWLAWLMFPLHVIGEITKPVSLSIRLFGNIFGEDMIIMVLMVLAAFILPAFLPIPLQFPLMLLAMFTSFVQALVFTMLIGAYIENFTAEEH